MDFLVIIGGLAAALVIVLLLDYLTRIPRPPRRDEAATLEERVSALEHHAHETNAEWRRGTRRYMGIVFAGAAAMVMFTSWMQNTSHEKNEDRERNDYNLCVTQSETRSFNRRVNEREITNAEQDLVEAQNEPPFVPETIPGFEEAPTLLTFFAAQAAIDRDDELDQLTRDLARLRADAAEYATAFPLPDCADLPGAPTVPVPTVGEDLGD